MTHLRLVSFLAPWLGILMPAFAGGVNRPTFIDETDARLVASPSVGASNPDEKDYAWGDVDQDGDIDLVAVYKEPFTTPGRRRNVLFMNEGGVLVDRTQEYATAADDGGNGFLDLTNDRDVALVDVDANRSVWTILGLAMSESLNNVCATCSRAERTNHTATRASGLV